MPEPLRLAFLGCGFITRVHSRHLKRLRPDIVCAYASREGAKAEAFCREFGGLASYRGLSVGDRRSAQSTPWSWLCRRGFTWT